MGTAVAADNSGDLVRAVALRRRLHAIPELGHAEVQTAAAVRAALAPLATTVAAGTGVIVRVGPAEGPQVVLRAELDALPVEEQTGVPWAATNGAMHACGHDVHAAALVAAIHELAGRELLPLGVVGVFQPSEETYPSGAVALLDAGVFDHLDVAAVAAMHVHPDVPFGSVALTPGPVNAATDEVRITVRGAAGHAAYPHHGPDAVAALAQVVVALQQVVARRVDPVHPTVLTIGTLQAGTAANVIPQEAVATGTLRCLHGEDRERLRELISTGVEATARAFGCEAVATFVTGEPALVNDPALVAATTQELPDQLRRHDADLRSCGADDVAELARLGPALMGFVGLAGHPAFTPAALHSPTFLPPDDAVAAVTSSFLAAYAGATRMHAAS